MEHKQRYEAVVKRKITPTKFLCESSLYELGILPDVRELLKNVNVYQLAKAGRETKSELTIEFFSSVQFEGGQVPTLRFRLNSRDRALTVTQFRRIFCLPAPRSAGTSSGAPVPIRDFWEMISPAPYTRVAQTSASQVFSICFRYVMRLMAFTIFMQGDLAQKVRNSELELLTSMIFKDQHGPDLALVMMKELAGASGKPGEISEGGIVSIIAVYLEKEIPGTTRQDGTPVHENLLDIGALVNMKILRKEGPRYYVHDPKSNLKIFLPDPDKTTVRLQQN